VPIPINEAIAESAELARTKAVGAARLPRFLVSAMLAGAYIGIGIIALAACAGPFLAAGSPAAKLVAGAAFGIALTLRVMAGAELFTGNVMIRLFWRAVLCNLLVCLAVWMAARTRNDAAKTIVIWWCLMAFIVAGFEHSIANMTIFGLALFVHHATFADLVRNLAWTVPGNIVGGGLLVAYNVIGGREPVADEVGEFIEPVAAANANGNRRQAAAVS